MDRWESPLIEFTIACSKGTYVRTVAHDLGQVIGCGAHLTDLRRTEIERFVIEDSITLDEFEEMSISEIQKELIPPYQAVPSPIL